MPRIQMQTTQRNSTNGRRIFVAGAMLPLLVVLAQPATLALPDATLVTKLDLAIPNARFGFDVAVNGSFMVVGAPHGGRDGSGTAFVFHLHGDTWVSSYELPNPNPSRNDEFGYSVDLSPSTLVVGAPGAKMKHIESGAVYVYTLDGLALWRLQQWGAPSDAGRGARFGAAVDVASPPGVIAVGAPGAAHGTGAVYLFGDRNLNLQQAFQRVTPQFPERGSRFGESLDHGSSFYVVGAPGETAQDPDLRGADASSRCGAVYVYRYTAFGGWTFERRFRGSTNAGTEFAAAVDVLGDQILVGTPGARTGRSGVAESYEEGGMWSLFRHDADRAEPWSRQATGIAADTDTDMHLGRSVILLGDAVLGGAPGADTNGPRAGKVYVFEDNGAFRWVEESFVAPDTQAGDEFGWAMAPDGGYLVVGAPGHGADDRGAVYVFGLAS